LRQQLRVDRTVRTVAGGASFSQRRMLEHKRPRLLFVALRAVFIHARHRQPPRRFHDVAAVRVMALHAIHLLLQNRMMLWQVEFAFNGAMALETCRGILARIHNEFPAPAPTLDMQAAWPMA